jgi:hypothetical protein
MQDASEATAEQAAGAPRPRRWGGAPSSMNEGRAWSGFALPLGDIDKGDGSQTLEKPRFLKKIKSIRVKLLNSYG